MSQWRMRLSLWKIILMSSATNENKLSTTDPALPEQKSPFPSPAPRRAIEFRFIVNFGPQLSTPCSRCLEVSPPPTPSLIQSPGQLFHRYLRCHTFTL